MSIVNPVYEFPGFGIYFLELGKYFKDKFKSFQIVKGGNELTCQVFFGTPRAAFRYFYKRFNGVEQLPMINYHNTSTSRRPEFEKPNAHVYSQKSYNPITHKYEAMRAPMRFDLSYSVMMWNNNYRERDYMIHALLSDFRQGVLNLVYYPDMDNYPDSFLVMPVKMEGEMNDETEIEGLEPEQTRDKIRTSFTLSGEAFLPFESYEVGAVEWVGVDVSLHDINDILSSSIYAPDLAHPQVKLQVKLLDPKIPA